MDLSLRLEQIFPKTRSLLDLQQWRAVQSEFLNNWGFERLHFFPMMIRQKRISQAVTETVDYEFLHHWLKTQEADTKLQGNHLYLNPTAQVLLISASAEVLQKEPGAYILWKAKSQVSERKLSRDEAELLELLQEDQMTFRQDLDSEELEVLRFLIEQEIVLENGASLKARSQD